MRRRFLRKIAESSYRFAGVVFVILALLTSLAVFGLRHLRLDTGLADFLPPQSPLARLMSETVQDYRNLEPILVSLKSGAEGSDAELIALADEFAAMVSARPEYFTRPVYQVDERAQAYYDSLPGSRLMALMTPRDWEYLRGFMQSETARRELELFRARRLSLVLPRGRVGGGEDPLGMIAAIRERIANSRVPIQVHPREGYFFSADGLTLFMLLYPVKPADDALHAWNTNKFLTSARDALLAAAPGRQARFTVSFAGSHIETARQIGRITGEVGLIAGSSLLFVLLLLILVFRKAEAVAFIMIPPILGTVWALGLAHAFCYVTGINTINELGTIHTRITGVTLAFLLITFGIGMNYAIHLFHRFTIELYRTQNYYRALQISFVETGRGALASALTSALIFFSLWLTSFQGLKELGVLAGVATLCNLAAALLVVPVLAAFKSKLARGRITRVDLSELSITGICEPAIRTPRATLTAMLALTVFLGVNFGPDGPSVPELRFHPRFASIPAYLFRSDDSAPAPAVGGVTRPGRPVIALVEGKTMQEALEKNDRLYNELEAARRGRGGELGILAVDSLRVVLPSLATQKESFRALEATDLDALRSSIARATFDVGLNPTSFRKFLDALGRIREDVAAGRLDAHTVTYAWDSPDSLQGLVLRMVMHVGETFRIATPIYPGPKGFTPAQLAEITRLVAPTGSGVRFIGDPMIERELAERLKLDLALLTLACCTLVFLALWLHFRNPRHAVLAMIPVVAQVLWVTGAMSMTGVTLHFMTLIALTVIITLSVGNSIHMLQYFIDRRPSEVRRSVVTIGRATAVSCCSVGLLYGMLSLTAFEGLRDLGRVIIYGSFSILIATLMLLPALIRIWGGDQPLINALGPPADGGEQER